MSEFKKTPLSIQGYYRLASKDPFDDHKTNIGQLTNYTLKTSKPISRNIKQHTTSEKASKVRPFPILTQRNTTQTFFNPRRKLNTVDKSQVQRVLKKCYELSKNGKAEPKERLNYMKKVVGNFEEQFIMNPQAVSDIIQEKAKSRMRDDLINIQEKGLNYVHTIIEEKAKKRPKKEEYTIFDSLAQDLKTKRSKVDYYTGLISLPKIGSKTASDSARLPNTNDPKIEELRKRFAVSVNKYINEINVLKSSINSIVPTKNVATNSTDHFLYALKNNQLDIVVQAVHEQPELINRRFSVNFEV